MNRNSGNVSKTKKLISGAGNNSKHNRKVFHNLSDSSSISSNRNSSGHSEEDVRVSGVYIRPQVDRNASREEQEQITRKLQAQVKELRHKLRILEESVDSKDYSLGTIAREKDRAVGEIRRLERSNKLLRQQLNEERNHYLEEKEKFCEEMTKYKKKLQDVKSETDERKGQPLARQPLINQSLKWQLSREKGDFVKQGNSELKKSKSQKQLGVKDKKSIQLSRLSFHESQIRKPSSFESLHLYEGNDSGLQLAALRTENAKLRSIICERDERNYELCLRFLRMKHYKNDIKDRFLDLENEYLQVIANLLDKIDEARQEFNFIIDQKFKRPLHSTNAMYLQMIQKNSRMAFENASLRLENQCLKKEIHKYMNSSSEFDSRKVDSATANDDGEGKIVLQGQKSEQKLKRIKKNVNFKEIRTIYERELNFKNSDTDSNYMSKTSTAPSNVSLGDPKSSESTVGRKQCIQDKVEANFQANSLPEEILNKLFKRVDSSSSQTLDTNRSKHSVRVISELSVEKIREEPIGKNVHKEPPIIEHKGPPKTTEFSSTSDSKVFVAYEAKKSPEPSPRRDAGTVAKQQPKSSGRKQEKQESIWTFKSRWRNQVRKGWNFEKDATNHLDLSLGRFGFSGKARSSKKEKAQERKVPMLPKPFPDRCGLEEKFDLSDVELPTSTTGESRKSVRELSTRTEESDYDDGGGKSGRRHGLKCLPPAVGSRSRSSNKLSLYDELMELNERRPNPGASEGAEETDSAGQRRPEASKRFSHRLFSTSPEQLKSILTESQLGNPFQMGSVIVGHATTEVTPSFKPEESGNDIYLQLVLPPESPSQTYANYLDAGMTEGNAEKEDSASCRTTARQKSSQQVETCPSDVRLPGSSPQTSTSTVEMVDGVPLDRTRIMMRTLSAPGLLESSWLDPYTVCEMRDCSTNT